MERKEITGSPFLVLTNFGDHCLHHMFPTLDHSTLEHLYPTFKKVSAEKPFNRLINEDFRFWVSLTQIWEWCRKWTLFTEGSSSWLKWPQVRLHQIWTNGILKISSDLEHFYLLNQCILMILYIDKLRVINRF